MTEATAAEILLPNEHLAADCWNPHYHHEPYRDDLAKIFEDWYRKQYGKNDNEHLSYKAGPLCIFGGVSFNKAYLDGVQVSGTYAVCPNCKEIIMCGYHDEYGLGPKKCKHCSTELSLNCYFQPIEISGHLLKPGEINPERDPYVALAEVAALAKSGIPFNIFEDVVFILVAEKLIATPDYLYGEIPFTRETKNSLLWLSHRWISTDSAEGRRNVKVSDEGKVMLRARSIVPFPGAKRRVRELLRMSDNKRYALVLRSRADLLETV